MKGFQEIERFVKIITSRRDDFHYNGSNICGSKGIFK
jgi:hypothetical protein